MTDHRAHANAFEPPALRPELRLLLIEHFGVDACALGDESPLFTSGLVDSLGVMEVVSLVASCIGHAVPPRDITLENFDSIERIARYAASRVRLERSA